jgi:hypothetical protein
MKKLLTLAALVSATTLSFAQGTLLWNNTSGTLISLDGATSPARVDANSTINFGIFIAPFGTAAPAPGLPGASDPNWQFVGAYGLNSSASPAGVGRLQNPGQATIAGFAPGTTVNFIIAGWRTTAGGVAADWSAARNSLLSYGHSTLGFLILGGGAIPDSSAFGTTTSATVQQVGGFNVVTVPEPSSMALAGLGAAGLLLFRRRK